jgi:hypothetical protein
MPGATYVRERANTAASYAELDEMLLEYREFVGGHAGIRE